MHILRSTANLLITLTLCALAAWFGLAGFVWTRIADHVERSANTTFLDPALNPTAPVPFIENDRDLGYRPVPGAHFLKRDPHGTVTEVATDKRGFRVDGPGQGGQSRVDILVVGCSQTWGQGIAGAQTFSSILGRTFGLRVANAAVPGYGTVQSLLMAERHVDLRPRVIVYGFFVDHLFRNFERQSPRPIVERVGGAWRIAPSDYRSHPAFDRTADALVAFYGWFGVAREVTRGPVEAELRTAFRAIVRGLGLPEADWIAKTRPTFDEMPTTVEAARMLLAEMAALARRVSAHLVVVWLPGIPELTPFTVPFPAELSEFVQRSGGTPIDMYPVFRPYAGTERAIEIVVPGDGHMNEKAHALVAEAVAQSLAAPPLSLRRR